MSRTAPAATGAYRCVTAVRLGTPDVLEVTTRPLASPGPGRVRIRVRAASVSRPDVTTRAGTALYSGTPLGKKAPFVPGYAVVGDVDAVGQGVTAITTGTRVGVLCVVGGYTEVLESRADRLIPVPDDLDPAEEVTLLLNYLVAYQALHRAAKVRRGEIVLTNGASGGIGSALLQLGKLAGVQMYGVASAAKHDLLEQWGATPIDYRRKQFDDIVRSCEPDGIDVVLDGVNSLDTVRRGYSLLRRGGRLVAFGEPPNLRELAGALGLALRVALTPNGRIIRFYGTSSYFLFNRKPYDTDWATLLDLLKNGQIRPVIAARLLLTEAAAAHTLLERGSVTGNVVLVPT